VTGRVPAAGEVWPNRHAALHPARILSVVEDAPYDRMVVTHGYVDHHAVVAQELVQFVANYLPPDPDPVAA
jgi:hypothetical protein